MKNLLLFSLTTLSILTTIHGSEHKLTANNLRSLQHNAPGARKNSNASDTSEKSNVFFGKKRKIGGIILYFFVYIWFYICILPYKSINNILELSKLLCV